MILEEALQIAQLLNGRNELVRKYTGKEILSKKENYVVIFDKEKIVACAESKRVQWYQWEISHVSVAEKYEGKGNGNRILKLAEEKAISGGAKILQCTIRKNNENSIRLFSKNEYKEVNTFYNPQSGNQVLVYQKSVDSAIERI